MPESLCNSNDSATENTWEAVSSYSPEKRSCHGRSRSYRIYGGNKEVGTIRIDIEEAEGILTTYE